MPVPEVLQSKLSNATAKQGSVGELPATVVPGHSSEPGVGGEQAAVESSVQGERGNSNRVHVSFDLVLGQIENLQVSDPLKYAAGIWEQIFRQATELVRRQINEKQAALLVSEHKLRIAQEAEQQAARKARRDAMVKQQMQQEQERNHGYV